MDIYQRWVTYNPKWSIREIAVFIMILILAMVIVFSGIRRQKWKKIQGIAMIILVIFLGIVFGSTVFTRVTSVRQYELKPFWSWYEVVRYHDWKLLEENLLNCILLMPMGILLPVIFDHKVKLKRAFFMGFLISAVIELSQLVFKRGLFEWDDMFHNALGCMLGCWFSNWLFVKLKNFIRNI